MDQSSKTQNQNQKHEEEEHGSYEQVPLSETNEKAAPSSEVHSTDYAPYPKLSREDVEDNPGAAWTTTMGSPANPEAHPANQQAATSVAKDHQSNVPPLSSSESNPYITTAPAPASSKGSVEVVRDTIGRWGKKVGEATKRAEDFAGNFWQHLKTGPSLADTAMERLAQGTKVLAEGGYEKIFRQTFEPLPEEQLQKTYACYLSTSAGPVIGTLYLTNLRLAFCSDNPLSYKLNPDKTEWSFYKVVLPLHQLKAVNASANRTNPAEKYIQIISTSDHEFWFMGFVNYDKAVKNLQGILRKEDAQPSVGLIN